MGTSFSAERKTVENLEEIKVNINRYRNATKTKKAEIIAFVDRIKSIIIDRGYNTDDVCARIIVQNYDELVSLEAYVGKIYKHNENRYKLGLEVKDKNTLKNLKDSTCTAIKNLYVAKIQLLDDVKKAFEEDLETDCIQEEANVNLDAFLGLNAVEQKQLYLELEGFNKKIFDDYSIIRRQIEKIKFAKNNNQLNVLKQQIFISIGNTRTLCKNSKIKLENFMRVRTKVEPLRGIEMPSKTALEYPFEPVKPTGNPFDE